MRLPRLAVLAAVLMVGCVRPVEPRVVNQERFDFNEALAQSQNEQLLLNLVRLRYLDTPLFLDVSAVVASRNSEQVLEPRLELGRAGGATTGLGVVGGSLRQSFSPTVNYTPLQGEAFATRFMSPISTPILALLVQSGWSLDRILRCCALTVCEVPNTPGVGGLMPTRVLETGRFQTLAGLVRDLQEEGVMNWAPERDKEGGHPLVFNPTNDRDRVRIKQLRDLLGLSSEGPFRVVGPEVPFKPEVGNLPLRTRSLLGMMAFLAQGVEIPASDLSQRRVRVALGPDGRPFDWKQSLGGYFQVHESAEEPRDAFVKTRYRGHWFYLDDGDPETKATFSLLVQVFTLQGTSEKALIPTLTLPVK